MAEKIFLTEEGKQELEKKLEYLKMVKRPEITERIKIAREFGDLSENAEYDAARNEQALIEGEISELEAKLKVAEIKEVSKVEGSDKLLKFRLDAGDDGDRQILSGIAKWYPNPEELIGKKVIAVTNLQPRMMMGQVSQGMLLSGEYDEGKTVKLITVSDEIPAGSLVG